MKKIIKTALLLSIAALIAVSCNKKDDDEATPSATKTDMLSGTWKYVSIMVKDSTGKEVDILIVTPEGKCLSDDTYTFTKAGSITYDPKSLKCDAEETGGTGTWKWANNETEISIDDGDSGLTWSSVEITANSLKYSQDFDGTIGKATMKK